MANEFINPNWHIILIHYPLALVVVGFLIELFSFLWRRSGFRVAGRWMILLGALSMIPAAFSGIYAFADAAKMNNPAADGIWAEIAAQTPLRATGAWDQLVRHTWLQSIATVLLVASVVAWIGCSDLWRKRLHLPLLIVLAGGVGLMAAGAWFSGEAVYRHGAAVELATGSDTTADMAEEGAVRNRSAVTVERPATSPGAAERPVTPPAPPTPPKPEAPKAPEAPVVPATPPRPADPPAPARSTPTEPATPKATPAPATAPTAAPATPQATTAPAADRAVTPTPPPTTAPVTRPAAAVTAAPTPPPPATTKPAETRSPAPTTAPAVEATTRATTQAAATTQGANPALDPAVHVATEEQTLAKRGVEYFLPPLQTHVFLAGVAVALAVAALGLSIRRVSETPVRDTADASGAIREGEVVEEIRQPLGSEAATADAQADLSDEISAGTDIAIKQGGRTPAGRFWLLTALTVLLTMTAGWWTLASESEAFEGRSFGEAAQVLWEMVCTRDLNTSGDGQGSIFNRRLLHVVTGTVILIVPLVLAGLSRWGPRAKLWLWIFAVLLILAVAAQIWLGILLTYDLPEGPVTRFNTAGSL